MSKKGPGHTIPTMIVSGAYPSTDLGTLAAAARSAAFACSSRPHLSAQRYCKRGQNETALLVLSRRLRQPETDGRLLHMQAKAPQR